MSDQARQGSGFQRVLEVWSRRKWQATAVLTVVLAGSLSFVWSLPPLYRSTATVLVDRKEVPESFVRPAVTGELETRLETLTQEILSRGRLEDLVKQFDLYPGLRKGGSLEDAVEQMRRDIQREVKATEPTGGRPATISFTLSYRGRHPDTVARVTNALASLYVQENAGMRERQATGTAQFLKVQLADMKQKLEEQERRIGTQPQSVETELASLERLNSRLRINTDRQLRALDRRERILKGADVVEVGGAAGPPSGPEAVKARIAKLQQDLAGLRTRFSDKYPDVVSTKAEIAALERRLAEMPPEAAPERSPARKGEASVSAGKGGQGKDPLAEIASELKMLKDEERTLRQAIASYETRVDSAPKRQQEYQREARDYGTLKDQYQSLLKRYEDAQMAESMEQGKKGDQFRILDAALPAKEPVAPSRTRLGLLGLVLSLGMAVGAVVLAESFDGSFHSADELRAFSKVPVLAGIPRLVTEGDALRRVRRRWLRAMALLILLAVVAGTAYLLAHGNEELVRTVSMPSKH